MKNSCKTVVKFLSLVLMILFFVPAFFVSCSGEEVNVSAAGAMVGYKSDSYTLSDPQPILILLLLIPIVIAIVMFSKKFLDNETKQSLIVMIAAIVDLVIWIIFKSRVANFCEENMCSFGVRFGYVINVICLLVTGLIGAGIFFGVIKDNGLDTSSINSVPIGKINLGSQKWTCPNCGEQVDATARFCMKCGTAKPVTEKKCKYCGTINPVDNKFCTGCGKEFEVVVEHNEESENKEVNE